MCTVHVNQVCDGEVPECYDGWEALLLAETERKQAWITRQNEMERIGDLITIIDNAECYFDEHYEVCCSLYGCNCYENHKSDMADAIAQLATLNFVYVDDELCEITYVDGKLVSTKVNHCCECGLAYIGNGHPIGIINPDNCGNSCYNFVDGVYMGDIPASVDNAMEAEYPDAF